MYTLSRTVCTFYNVHECVVNKNKLVTGIQDMDEKMKPTKFLDLSTHNDN